MLGLLDIITVFYGTKLGSIRNKQRPNPGLFKAFSAPVPCAVCDFLIWSSLFSLLCWADDCEFCLQVLLVLGLMYPLGPQVA